MNLIDTVNGPRPVAELGTVLPAEHIFVVDENYRLNYLPDWDEEQQIDDAVAALTKLKAHGVDTIADTAVLGLGRNIARIQRVAARTDINILAGTGLFTYNDLPFQFHYTATGLGFDVPEPLVDLFVGDLTRGIAGTGVKASFLVCVIEAEGLTAGVERVMRAVGQAAVATGAPVVVSTNPHTGSGGIAQRVLAEEGVDLRRVLLRHSGDSTDLDQLMQLADAGSILGLDRFGLDLLLPFGDRMDVLVALLERGYADRIVLGQGAAVFHDWFDQIKLGEVAPDWNLFQVTDRVIPELRRRGVSDAAIRTMTVDVPARLYTTARDTTARDTTARETPVPQGPTSLDLRIPGLNPENPS